MSDEPNIIQLWGSQLEIEGKPQPSNYCSSNHKNIVIDNEARVIACRECGKVLDPFEYLAQWARQGDRRMQRLKALDVEIRIKAAEIEALKAVLAREKAKVRQINPDAPEVQAWRRQLAVRRSQ